jgi:nucleotide-binding universal stress UspA family protein
MSEAEPQTHGLIQNILCATDLSPASRNALTYGMAIARRRKARLFLAHVIVPHSYQLEFTDAAASTQALIREHVHREMAKLMQSEAAKGVTCETTVEEGRMWPSLSRLISLHKIDLVIVGTHGRTGAEKALLGSAAEQIFRLAECPVMTVGPSAVPPEKEAVSPRLRHVLYPTDFRPGSERAAAYAASFAAQSKARLTLLHVVRAEDGMSDRGTHLIEEFFRARLHRLLPERANLEEEAELAVEYNRPVEKILEVAHRRQSDLIVMGVRRMSEFPGHLPPETAYQIVCQAPCPVITIRQ